MDASVSTATMSPNRVVGALLGVVFLLVGVVGFIITGFSGFAGTQGEELIVFEVNPLHNIVHLGVGAVLLLAAWRGAKTAAGANLLIGLVYGAVGIAGFFAIDTAANIIALNQADNWLHIASAAVLVGVGLTRR